MKVHRYAQATHPESGLFAARFIPEGQLAAFYSGLVVHCDIDFFALSARSPQHPTTWNKTVKK